MQLRQLFTDEGAVSPVIGVILMVAITVILAAVIGSFVLGIGSRMEKKNAPQVQFSFDWEDNGNGYSDKDDHVIITHIGGTTVTGDRLSISAGEGSIDITNSNWQTDITAGDSLTIGEINAGSADVNFDDGNYLKSGNKLRIIWMTEGKGASSVTVASSTLS